MEFLERLRGAMTLSESKGWIACSSGFVEKSKPWTLKFVTLTWATDVGKRRVRLDLAHLVQWIRRKYGYCEYAKVPELTKAGRIHLHLVMVMPFIWQPKLSKAWKKYAKAPIVDIQAVRGLNWILTELTKYLTKAPAGKVTYSRQFPKPERVTVKPGPCEACDGQEHRFEFLPEWRAVEEYPLEEHGRWLAGEPVYQAMCGCWPAPT